MKQESSLKLTYGLWGVVGGAVLAMTAGFGWGGWTTAKGVEKVSGEAVISSQAAICAAQFMNTPSHDVKAKQFQELEGYRRTELVEKEGWDRMPGQDKAAWGVSGPCAGNIEALLKQAQAKK
jgi:hypothetical protein